MNSSLPSYDLQRLFHNIHTTPTTKVEWKWKQPHHSKRHSASQHHVYDKNLLLVQESGGESLITDEAVFSDASTGSGKTNSNNSSSIMTDSLHAVVWEEEEEQ